MKEAAFGLVPDLAGTHPLVAAVGYRRALDICLTTRPVGAGEAVATGLAVRAVPARDRLAAVDDAGGIPGGAGARNGGGTKQLLSGAALRSPPEQRLAERPARWVGCALLASFGG